MSPLPPPPTEVPEQHTSAGSAPKFVEAVDEMLAALAGGLPEMPFEWLRTEARQMYLAGFGILYDEVPPRGIVTRAKTALFSHHGFGCGVDVVTKTMKGNASWNAPPGFWAAIALAAEATGRLKSGHRWKKPDDPHVYWAGMPDDLHGAAGDRLRAILAAEGLPAVWAEVGAA